MASHKTEAMFLSGIPSFDREVFPLCRVLFFFTFQSDAKNCCAVGPRCHLVGDRRVLVFSLKSPPTSTCCFIFSSTNSAPHVAPIALLRGCSKSRVQQSSYLVGARAVLRGA